MTRQEATEKILQAKQERGLAFEEIARAVGRHKVWTTAALLGQATMSKEELEIERVPDRHGDRVKVTYNGKFLPYKKW